jgi:hypothetical protein
MKTSNTKRKLAEGSSAKLKGIKMTMAVNPKWTKQIAVVKKEIIKLNKLQAFTIS